MPASAGTSSALFLRYAPGACGRAVALAASGKAVLVILCYVGENPPPYLSEETPLCLARSSRCGGAGSGCAFAHLQMRPVPPVPPHQPHQEPAPAAPSAFLTGCKGPGLVAMTCPASLFIAPVKLRPSVCDAMGFLLLDRVSLGSKFIRSAINLNGVRTNRQPACTFRPIRYARRFSLPERFPCGSRDAHILAF